VATVIESAHFRELPGARWAEAWRSVRPSTRLVERLRRVDARTIDYQVTWEDPVMFTKLWTARYPLTNDQASTGSTAGQLFEDACHEGNYSAANVLRAARVADRAQGRGSTR
jgi:hypothetical protein